MKYKKIMNFIGITAPKIRNFVCDVSNYKYTKFQSTGMIDVYILEP